MTDYRDQVMQALRAVRVTSATTYAWFGRRSPPLPKPVVMAMSADTLREYLVGLLGSELYRSFYTQGRAVLVDPDTARPDRPDGAFVEGCPREQRDRGVGRRLAGRTGGRGGSFTWHGTGFVCGCEPQTAARHVAHPRLATR